MVSLPGTNIGIERQFLRDEVYVDTKTREAPATLAWFEPQRVLVLAWPPSTGVLEVPQS